MATKVTVTCECGTVFEYIHTRGQYRTKCNPKCKGSKPPRPTSTNCKKCGTEIAVGPIGKIPQRCVSCRSDYKPKTEPQEAVVTCVRCGKEFDCIVYANGRLPKRCKPCKEEIEREKVEAREKRAEYKSVPPEVLAKERIDQLTMMLMARGSHISQHPEVR